MLQFIFKRLLHMIPLLLGVSLLTFLLMAMSPGNYFTALQQNPQISPDTIAQLKAQFHLDRPWYVQYFFWLKNVLSGNFGYSMAYKISATSLIHGAIMEHVSAFVFRADHRLGNRHSARHLGGGQKGFVGGPRLFLCRLCRAFGSRRVALAARALVRGGDRLVSRGRRGKSALRFHVARATIWDRAHHLILPAIVLAASDLAGIMRRMRSCLLDTLRAEYITAARARGLGEGWVVWKHALRNAINPLLTIFGYSLAALLSGAFIVENIMAWPGLGRLTMEAFFAKDSYLVVDCVVMATALLVIGNFIADILLAWSDPRIRLK